MRIDEINREIAKKLNLRVSTVKQINKMQWKFIFNTLCEGKNTVKPIHFGTFHPREHKRYMFIEYDKRLEEKITRDIRRVEE